MTQRKGLSQILYLIIAASVLMMAALSLIFMFNDAVGGGTGDLQACNTAIDTRCSTSGASSVEVPSTCTTTNAEGDEEEIDGFDGSRTTNSLGDDNYRVSC